MLYNNDSQEADSGMTHEPPEYDAARQLQAAVWAEVHRAFERRRAEQGLTQAELARRIGLQRERVHYWMSRPERMTLAAAARLMAGMNGRLECRGRLEIPVEASEAAR